MKINITNTSRNRAINFKSVTETVVMKMGKSFTTMNSMRIFFVTKLVVFIFDNNKDKTKYLRQIKPVA